MTQSPPTIITPSTEANYRNRIRTAMRLAEAAGYGDDLLQWLADNTHTMSHATFRLTKAALRFFAAGNPEALEYLSALRYTKPESKLPLRTSAKKARRLEPRLLARVRAQLAARPTHTRWHVDLGLYVTSMFGARPNEWRFAKLQGNKLTFINAKTSQGRSHGPTRELILDCSPEDLERLQSWLNVVAQYASDDQQWRRFYQRVRKALYRANKKLNVRAREKHIALYSARHQFAADQKATGRSKVEIAATMGHASPDTAGRHYGRRKHGSGNSAVRPCEQDVKRVEALSAKKISDSTPAPQTTKATPTPSAPDFGPKF